jgi:tetratricopeptide (TPR) repeat protein/NAD-dependent SIR2 family protein deacetylase
MKEHKKTEAHLIDLILDRNNSTPNFALFIGAGASVSSGVKAATEMVEEWRYRLYEQSHSREKYEDWLSKQEWFNSDKEYSILFEKVCDTPAQRRTCVENCVKDVKPSWGYMYLANLITNNFFNVIFTTNFDDLLNEACFLYAELKPIVCAHDSAVANVRVTSARPKIIKLHGDFLYDDIKSTVLETSRLEQNMEDKFTQFAREYGLVIVGYGGRDDSIIKILKELIKTEGYFPHGIYWCVPRGAELSKKAKKLVGMNRVYWVEIEGFDEFMANLHKKSGLQLPDLIKDPYRATTDRLNTFISRTGIGLGGGEKIQNPIILEDMNLLQKTIKAFEGAISGKEEEVLDKLVPYAFLGRNAYLRHEYHDAIAYFKKADMLGSISREDMEFFSNSYLAVEDFKNAEIIIKRLMRAYPESPSTYSLEARLYKCAGNSDAALNSLQKALTYSRTNEMKSAILVALSNSKLLTNDFSGALADAEESLRLSKGERSAADINRSIALKKLGRVDEATKILNDVLKRETFHYFRAGAFAVLGNKRDMLKELKVAVEMNSASIIEAKTDPDFIDYRDDPKFKQIVYRQKPKK